MPLRCAEQVASHPVPLGGDNIGRRRRQKVYLEDTADAWILRRRAATSARAVGRGTSAQVILLDELAAGVARNLNRSFIMDLVLWRHGPMPNPGDPDRKSGRLTAKGKKQARRVGRVG